MLRRGHAASPTPGVSGSAPSTPMHSPGLEHPALAAEGVRRIQLDQPYAYRSLDKVSGVVNHEDIPADRIKVHLVGATSISHQRFIQGAYRPVEKSWEFLRLTKKFDVGTDPSTSTTTTTTTFGFRLPEALLETHCPLRVPLHLLLPPTLGLKRDDGLDDMSPKDPINARISYTIVAEFYRAGQVVQTLRKAFRVAPRHFSSPHTMNPPPQYDEIITVEEDVNRTIGGKIGTLKLTGQQPPALLSSLEEHQITTRVPLTIEFHSITTAPPKIHGIGIKLRAHTSSRVEHLLESGEDISRSVEVRLNKLSFSRNHGPVWRAHRPGVWLSELEVPVTLCPRGYVAIPEFESCLVDRRYEITLKFELVATGMPLSETRLTIPVWIFADEYYGIPSEARPGVKVKTMKRFSVPTDVDADGPGSLPNYEDTYLSNLAHPAAQGPLVVGDGGTVGAPFSLQGREPDYFARPRPPPPRTGPAQTHGQGPSRGARAEPMEIDGIDPNEGHADGEQEEARVPAWMLKASQEPGAASADPRDQDGAQ